MPPLNLLIKPASGNCNMRCRYCFYMDIAENRHVESYGIMNLETLETLVEKSLAYATNQCSFAFQGGEPTLAGLDFFKAFTRLVDKHNKKNLQVQYSIQTNGYVINREWADFLAKHKFLTGLSLDGIKDVHDGLRLDAGNKGTFSKVMHAAQLFNQYGVEYNILTVVTAQLVKNVGKIYGFYRKNNFLYQQYIPCLDPIGEERGMENYSLTPELYGEFLTALFDLWYPDISKGIPVSIRYFDNLVWLLRGYPPESCGMLGHCTMQNVVEADGEVYPCDFYVLDDYKLGNLNVCGFDSINERRKEINFIEDSQQPGEACRSCKWAHICRGGCRRDRDYGGHLGHNYFCSAFKQFFEHAYPRLQQLARTDLSKLAKV